MHLFDPDVEAQLLVQVAYVPSDESPETPRLDQTTVTVEAEHGSNWSQIRRADEWGCVAFAPPEEGRYHAFAHHVVSEHCQWYDGSRFDYNGTGVARLSYDLAYYCTDESENAWRHSNRR